MEKYLLHCDQRNQKVGLLLGKVRSENRGFEKFTLGKHLNPKILERELQTLEAEFELLNPRRLERMVRVVLNLFYVTVLN